MVMNADDEPDVPDDELEDELPCEEEDPVEELPVLPDGDELADALEPPPLTVSPTWSLTAVTVPLIGATRVVSSTVFWSADNVC